ncbi:MAG: rhodanese-like domain-containing protein [Deltaproteobacteria bacterium]|nr:rhodanese-like domain-containing protein [Deltaproteobacteria bacterium]
MKQTLYQILIILCAAIVISLLFNQIRPDPIKFGGVPLILNNDLPLHDNSVVSEISINNAYEVLMQGRSLLVDARSESDFEQGHIKGAVNLYEKEFDEWIDDFLSRTDPETKIITYCDGIHCSLGSELAEKFFSVGYNNVYYLANGLTRWKEKLKKDE